MTRPIWFAVGLVCVATGAVGTVVPLLPTTPFLLLAAFAFDRSSPRLHAWLVEHAQFGPIIQGWREHGSISRRTKIVSVAAMAATLALSFAMEVAPWIIAIQALVLAGSATFIVTRPERPRPATRGCGGGPSHPT